MNPAGEDAAPARRSYARHLDSLAAAARTGGCGAEAEAVAAVLRDPDPVMAESAVVTHLDRRAARLPAGAAFPGWAHEMTAAVAGRAFPARRLREWTLLKALGHGDPWSAEELTGASDWCQRTAVRTVASADALGLLAAGARTWSVRNTAAQRLRRRTTT
ncbi:hypothetical protein [Streptomyces sp. NPDC051567]|uniref:hypothetical protein n=1 Tax=Streptomyces sp. NPDC051567 TaxID=3365660 RepID=UPI00378A4538